MFTVALAFGFAVAVVPSCKRVQECTELIRRCFDRVVCLLVPATVEFVARPLEAPECRVNLLVSDRIAPLPADIEIQPLVDQIRA